MSALDNLNTSVVSLPKLATARLFPGKIAVVRQDLNAPIISGKVVNDRRLHASLPTLKSLLKTGCGIVILSHLGRPKPGIFEAELSLRPVATKMSELLNQPIRFVSDWTKGVSVEDGEIVLCENLRFYPGETQNDLSFAKLIARLGDVFVLDAFGAAHRAHASTVGAIGFFTQAVAGLLLEKEINALQQAMSSPKRPLLAIVGGGKVESKTSLLKNLGKVVDQLIVGGGIANTLLAAKGHEIGASLYSPDFVNVIRSIVENCPIYTPIDVVCATKNSTTTTIRGVNEVKENEQILDLGPKSSSAIADMVQAAGTVIWNGPLGVFEQEAFSMGTRTLAEAISQTSAFSLAGGGDTLAAIDCFEVGEDVDYISTGGGAFLEWLSGDTLPAIAEITRVAAEKKGLTL